MTLINAEITVNALKYKVPKTVVNDIAELLKPYAADAVPVGHISAGKGKIDTSEYVEAKPDKKKK
jgi:hypothetical protein